MQYRVILAKNGKGRFGIGQSSLPGYIITRCILCRKWMVLNFGKKNLRENMEDQSYTVLMLTAKARDRDRMEGIENGPQTQYNGKTL